MVDDEKEREFRLHTARIMFNDLARQRLDLHATIYGYIEQHLTSPEDFQESLGISKEEFGLRKHTALVFRANYRLEEIRNGNKSSMAALVWEIIGHEYTLFEINLPEDEFKKYSAEVALEITDKTVRGVYHSWNEILTIFRAAGIPREDAARAQILERAKGIPALSAFI